MVSDDVIEYWVKIVNDEIGRSDRNEQSIDYFKKLDLLANLFITIDGIWL